MAESDSTAASIRAKSLHDDALALADAAIAAARPDAKVREILAGRRFSGKVIAVAVGKAAYPMARACAATLDSAIDAGFLITDPSYLPSVDQRADIPGFCFLPASHPVPSADTVASTRIVLDAVTGLTARDTVIFLLSGGASSLFEDPLIDLGELQGITDALLAGGVAIDQTNAVRKRLSGVKAGRFALRCAPAHVLALILSDVPGGRMDIIASGPTCPDASTCDEANTAITACGIELSDEARLLLRQETPSQLENVENILIGDGSLALRGAATWCAAHGYEVALLPSPIIGIAREVGEKLAETAIEPVSVPHAYIGFGETTVQVCGHGIGGRNQEVALSAARTLDGRQDCCVLSVGSDGRDGPTDAAGGYADGLTAATLRDKGIDLKAMLDDNDSYHALAASDGLIFTGETGTNVSDIMIALRR